MFKEVMMVSGGIIVGAAICYGGYRLYKHFSVEKKDRDFFEEKVKEKEESKQKFNELLATQTYVDLLTTSELTKWFKENSGILKDDIKMIILTPTTSHMKGLGYPGVNELDPEKNILQVFYDNNNGVIKSRLVNFSNIDTNLEANLIEQEGMIVVTE